MSVHRTIEACPQNHFYHGKAISVTYSKCVSVAVVIQHAMRMCRIILLFMTCLAVLYFSTLSHKRHDLQQEKKLLKLECVFGLSRKRLYENLLFLRGT
jgi:hypothetical protein